MGVFLCNEELKSERMIVGALVGAQVLYECLVVYVEEAGELLPVRERRSFFMKFIFYGFGRDD